jgi:hypothetical protein
MLEEIVAHLPRVGDMLSQVARPLDCIILKCIAQLPTSTDPIAAKNIFES